MEDYIEINRKSWNNRVSTHLKSEFYGMDKFISGQNSLNSIELSLLGDLSGKKVLHLQCHFGQDTISLDRLGAEATGVDFSDKAIESARQIAAETGSSAKFICCDIYDLKIHLNKQFDIVFTSYGTIGWLPDLDKWADIIAHFLKPDGRFVFVEFHPVVWMFDDNFEKIGYNYFNSGAIKEMESGTYADRSADLSQQYIMWNHGMADVISNLIKNGLELSSMEEYDYSPYNCFKRTVEFEKGKFRIEHLQNKIPMVYSLMAVKK